MPNITYNDHPENTSPNDGDFFPFWDTVAAATRKISWTNIRSLITGYSSPNPNILINGDMEVWQRGTSFVSAANNTRVADKYKYSKAGAVVHDITQSTDVPTIAQSGNKSSFSLKIDVTTVDSAIAAGDFSGVQTFIEGYDYSHIKDQTVTLSFWVKSTKTGTFCVAFRNNGNDRSYIAEYTVSLSDTWEKKTITVVLNQSGGTENYTNALGLSIFFSLSTGSTFQTSAGSWQNGNFLGTSNQVNSTDNTANNFFLSQVKLEKASTASAFLARMFEVELALCMRYYWKSFPYATAPAQSAGVTGALRFIAGKAGALAQFSPSFKFPVPMRTVPTLTLYNPSAANGEVRDTTAGADCSATANATNSDENTLAINCTGNAGTAVGNQLNIHAAAEADL